MSKRATILFLALCPLLGATLVACGQKGALYLPTAPAKGQSAPAPVAPGASAPTASPSATR